MCQNGLNVRSLERGDLKLSTDGLNNNSPYKVQELLKILQSAWLWQSQGFKMVLKMESRTIY